ncbi:MAG: hypothetical protein IKV72_07745 [Firmicutes bacterium]|nr:hypothetical protein [Bacillota bacterium]MBR5489583.1 hypothetical protein [Bacillota bacterium]
MKGILFYFYSPMTWFAAFLVLVMLYLIINGPKGDDDSGKVAITTKDMLHDINEERREQGLYELPEVNTAAAVNMDLARKDKSFKSVPDFFWKLIFGRNKK